MKSIKFNSNNYINLGLTDESVSQTENVLLLGNVTNFFGCVKEDGIIDFGNIHEDIINNNFIWLKTHLLDFKSKLTVITSKADIKEYWTPFFKDFPNYFTEGTKKAKVSYTTAALEDFAKKFKITEDLTKLYVELIKFMQEKNMKFDKIIMNPPYNCGNKCISEARNVLTENGKMTVLAPLSCYKTLDNYKYIKSLEIVNPDVFTDATITKNLCVVQMGNNKDDTKSYSEYELESYDPNFRAFYEVNDKLPRGNFDYKGLICDTLPYKPTPSTWVAMGVRISEDGNHKNGHDVDWNLGNNTDLNNIRSIRKNGKYRYNVFFTIMSSPKSKDNFCTFMYNGDAKDNLFYKLMKSMNKDGAPDPAIPQIDWEAISDHPLWKKGDYDSAVLDVMGLKWNESKDGVVRK